jgi:hypothetical protein
MSGPEAVRKSTNGGNYGWGTPERTLGPQANYIAADKDKMRYRLSVIAD